MHRDGPVSLANHHFKCRESDLEKRAMPPEFAGTLDWCLDTRNECSTARKPHKGARSGFVVGVAARTEMIGSAPSAQAFKPGYPRRCTTSPVQQAGLHESNQEANIHGGVRWRGPHVANVSLLSCRTVAQRDLFQFEDFESARNVGDGQGSAFDAPVRVGHWKLIT